MNARAAALEVVRRMLEKSVGVAITDRFNQCSPETARYVVDKAMESVFDTLPFCDENCNHICHGCSETSTQHITCDPLCGYNAN